MGMDSLTSIQLRRALEAVFERPLPATLTFNFPTMATLTAFLANELFAAMPGASLVPVNDREHSSWSSNSHEANGTHRPVALAACDYSSTTEEELLALLASKLEEVGWKG